jgi:hypothetical protein
MCRRGGVPVAGPFSSLPFPGDFGRHPRYHFGMLLIRCATCKTKLFKYIKLGKGEVLRCHKTRIEEMLAAVEAEGKLLCPCGEVIAHDKGSHWGMVRKKFKYSGEKVGKTKVRK